MRGVYTNATLRSALQKNMDAGSRAEPKMIDGTAELINVVTRAKSGCENDTAKSDPPNKITAYNCRAMSVARVTQVLLAAWQRRFFLDNKRLRHSSCLGQSDGDVSY